MSLRELYQDIILDHGKTPRHQGRIENASHQQLGHNPLCGDKLMVYVQAVDNRINEIRFQGSGCAISMASASLMSEIVTGKTLAEMEDLFFHFHYLVTEGKEPAIDIGKLNAFSGVAEYPIRVKCATLAWHTLKAALHHSPSHHLAVSTEHDNNG